MVKNLPPMQETQVWSLGQEDPLEKVMATHSSVLAWRIPCTEETEGLQSLGLQTARPAWATNIFPFLYHFTFFKVKVKSFSCVWLFGTPLTVAYQASPSMGFSRQEYWNGLPFPSPGDLPDPGIKSRSPRLEADTLTSEPPRKPFNIILRYKNLKNKWNHSRIDLGRS